MDKRDVEEFIEEMEEIGDVWQEEDVERVYGEYTLAEALADRKGGRKIFCVYGEKSSLIRTRYV